MLYIQGQLQLTLEIDIQFQHAYYLSRILVQKSSVSLDKLKLFMTNNVQKNN